MFCKAFLYIQLVFVVYRCKEISGKNACENVDEIDFPFQINVLKFYFEFYTYI